MSLNLGLIAGRSPRLQPASLLRYWVASALVLGLAACKKKEAPPPQPTVVQVVTVQAQDVPIYREWVGSLAGDVDAQIRAEVSGYLFTRDYTEGSVVKEGQLLFQIDPRPFKAQLDQAKAKLAQDEAQQSQTQWNVERYAPLAKQSAISQQEYHNAVEANLAAQAQVQADQAAVESASLNLGYTRIIAPVAGVAGIAQAQIGDLVGPSGPVLTTVSSINPIRVYVSVSEQTYLDYRSRYTNAVERAAHERGLAFHLILADGSEYAYPGKFYFAGREINPTTGTIQLAVLFPNPGLLLRPGQFARVRFITQTAKGALVVPQRAVTELQGTYEVATVDAQNRVHLQMVTVGQQVGSGWVIQKGLQGGERIIVEGTEKVKDGVQVNPQPFAAEQAQK